MAYPLFDTYRCFLCFIPVLGYVLNKINLHKRTLCISFYVFVIVLFSFYVKVIVKENRQFMSNSILFKYRYTDYATIKAFDTVKNYLYNLDNDTKIFIFEKMAYAFKIESRIKINKYDLINDGNMGYNGALIYLNEVKKICSNNKCVFIVSKESFKDRRTQTNKMIVDYVINNYNYVDKIYSFEIYRN